MSETYTGGRIRDAIGCESDDAAVGAVHCLSLAAAPTFVAEADFQAPNGARPSKTLGENT